MEQVIFLDRDGTLNEEVHYLHRKEDLRILDGVPEAICMLREAGYKIVVVTNQAGVARGYFPESDVKALHQYMKEYLHSLGADIDCFFYCPHHPVYGNGAYKKDCRCRKPDIGMFEMAEQYFQVDKSRSWMIGDKQSDVDAGRNYGVRTVLVGTGYGKKVHQGLMEASAGEGESFPNSPKERSLPYDIYAETLMDAACAILESENESGS